ncbi:MAG: T9SS type A sorting domain-containing protein, partial [Nitrosopumilaceae archaeon]|nr:T9SS type A sorting domain-containing protein [Nitrosopumilaceae archaeon]NIU88662.1 T9SS type A sorting domain-containing protein [Nitrosopumilaceae archaeon]NIV66714.1 T9SS type A sorting domain-containing protein [Nitrosopumilaceae archaeon]NIX62666.1 T9SS type A sorting domain-containing protein [Nitrosopumilaceae archaeon]
AQKYLTIFPNPAQNNLQIEWSGEKEIEQIEIYNASGKTIWQENTRLNKSLKLNVSQWATGV